MSSYKPQTSENDHKGIRAVKNTQAMLLGVADGAVGEKGSVDQRRRKEGRFGRNTILDDHRTPAKPLNTSYLRKQDVAELIH